MKAVSGHNTHNGYSVKKNEGSRLPKIATGLDTPASKVLISSDVAIPYGPSRTFAPSDLSYPRMVKTSEMLELKKKARVQAERAMQQEKIFTIVGPYHCLRKALRRRGWVEKFANAPMLEHLTGSMQRQNPTVDDDAVKDGTGTAEMKVKPWEEEGGLYGLMSHIVRNYTPQFVFSEKCLNSRNMKSNQLVNHFGLFANHFTTKSGLCQNLRNVLWYDKTDPDTFFPRCYKMDESDEKEAFIADYRLTACLGFIKHFVEKYNYQLAADCEDAAIDSSNKENQSTSAQKDSRKDLASASREPLVQKHNSEGAAVTLSATAQTDSKNLPPVFVQKRLKKGDQVCGRALEIACDQCRKFIRFKEHKDIDVPDDRDHLSEGQWNQFLVWYYQFVHDGGDCNGTPNDYAECQVILSKFEEHHYQYNLDGSRNIWIIKPGSQSRGRGIELSDKLGKCLNLVEKLISDVMVIQKYIESPLLVYNTKFDIRQLFLVTDWNPLTVWWYKDCYLRFCSQQYTHDDFHKSIHLSNNSVQKHYQNGPRSAGLPEDNNWTGDEFDDFLRQCGHGTVWHDSIVPNMKKAILCSLLCSQERIEYRKSAYELYGADFMVASNMDTWLLEINASPSMDRYTKATFNIIEQVLEDTCKVVLDRKENKNADTGSFELLYQQKFVHHPPPVDLSLAVTGKIIKKIDKSGITVNTRQ